MKTTWILALAFLATGLAGCTGGDPSPVDGDGPAEWDDWINRDDASSGDDEGPLDEGGDPVVTGFDFPLNEGDWWDFRWSADYIRRYDGEITKSRGHVGTFLVELGPSVTIQGMTAYRLHVEGSYSFSAPEGTGVGWNFRPPWTHVALEEHVFYGSRDGATMEPIVDAMAGKVYHDFFPGWDGSVRERAVAPIVQFQLENEFLLEPALGREPFKYSSSSGDCYWDRNIAQEVCPAKAAGGKEDLHAWRPGVGPLGAFFMDSFSGELTDQYETWSVGLIGTSLEPDDAWEPELRSPWFRIANLPVQRAPDPTAVNVGDTFYVMGGDWDETVVDPLDLMTGEWGDVVGLPGDLGEIRAVPLETGFLVFERYADQIRVYEYRENTNAWTERRPLPLPFAHGTTAAVLLGGEVLFGGHQTDVGDLRTYIYQIDSNEWYVFEVSHSPVSFAKISFANVDGKLYLIGGSASHTTPLQVLRMQVDGSNDARWVHETDVAELTGTAWSAVGAGNAIVALGPHDPAGSTHVYDTSTAVWHTLEGVPAMHYGTPALFTAKGHVVMVPGTSRWGAPLGLFGLPISDLPGNEAGDVPS